MHICVCERTQSKIESKQNAPRAILQFVFIFACWLVVCCCWKLNVNQRSRAKTETKTEQKKSKSQNNLEQVCVRVFKYFFTSHRIQNYSLWGYFIKNFISIILYEEENCAIQSEFGKRQYRRKKSEIQIELDRYKVNGIGLRKKRHCHFFWGEWSASVATTEDNFCVRVSEWFGDLFLFH